MKLSTINHACCPHCGQLIAMTAASILQAGQNGVWCACPLCDSQWMHITREDGSHGPRRVDSPHLVVDHPRSNSLTPLPVESTVFIVDEDPVTRDRLGCLMAYAGYKNQTYSTAGEFLAADRSSSPGCLVFNFEMTVTSGRKLHQQLIQVGRQRPLIVLTTVAGMTSDIQTIQQNSFAFIQKSGDPKSILDAVKQALAQDTEARQREFMSTPRRVPGARIQIETVERTIDDIQLKER